MNVTNRPGKLYVFEGVDSVGKTELATRLLTHLRSDGSLAEMYASPGRTSGTLGEHVYRLHHNPQAFGINRIHPLSLQILHVAAHVDSLTSTILPTLDAGTDVVLDRFWWSTKAYGLNAGLSARVLENLLAVEAAAWKGRTPEKILLIRRGTPLSGEICEKWEAVRRTYDELAECYGVNGNVHVIENEGTVESASAQVLAAISDNPRR